jgi:hypothetical protein
MDCKATQRIFAQRALLCKEMRKERRAIRTWSWNCDSANLGEKGTISCAADEATSAPSAPTHAALAAIAATARNAKPKLADRGEAPNVGFLLNSGPSKVDNFAVIQTKAGARSLPFGRNLARKRCVVTRGLVALFRVLATVGHYVQDRRACSNESRHTRDVLDLTVVRG